MFDKNDDTFFDAQSKDQNNSNELLKMMEKYDKNLNFDIQVGDEVSGIITKVSNDEYIVDIQAKNEAIIKKEDQSTEKKVGDTITAYVVVNNGTEIILSSSLHSQKANKQSLIDAFHNTIPVHAKVSAVSKDGLTVNLFGQRAFCPISHIDIKYTDNVNQYLGKSFDFIITKISENGRNIIVSRIPLLEQAYKDKIKKLECGIENKDVFNGTVAKITAFGLFINIDGIEGLVHISELSWEHIAHPKDVYVIGQEVSCIVLKVEYKKPLKHTKISLSIKQVQADPWDTVSDHFSVGQTVHGKVLSLLKFGAFIELSPGIDGLLHISEMSWVKKINHPSEILSVGNSIDVTILSIDTLKKSISLTLKDLNSDPWNNIEDDFSIGKEVNGTIVKKSRYGYFIDLKDGVTGLLVYSNITSDENEQLLEGNCIPVTILSIDKESRRISLSYGKKSEEISKELFTEYSESNKKNKHETATEFGSALLTALNNRGNK